jgi:single-stranded-DNA-specific exonuclease
MDDIYACARLLLRESVVVPHTDADGLASGAIALRLLGAPAQAAVLIGRGATPFDADAQLPPGRLAVLDWGVRPLDRPAVFVDHHAPEHAVGCEHVVVCGYSERPAVSTAVLMRRIVPEAPAWLAAVGAFGDLGGAAFALPECNPAPRGAVRTLTALVNAPRRLPDGPVREALALLVESSSAEAALADPRAGMLEEAKAEWQSAYRVALATPPRVADETALIRFASPYQIHPLIAAAWRRRLAPRAVIAANDGYLPGRVNFAVRGGRGDLRQLLRSALPDAGGEFAHGHDRATGGSLEAPDFERLLAGLGLE